MTDEKRRREIKVEREKEMRTKGISKMISEGGLGADKYYNIQKVSSEEEEEENDKKDDNS